MRRSAAFAVCMAALWSAVPVSASAAAWSVERAPVPSVPVGGLSAVSCPSARVCVAIGQSHGALADRWNGGEWLLQKMRRVPGSVLRVSCSSPRACTAVGGEPETGPVVARWNGTRWRSQDANGGGVTGLDGVSCPSARVCFAVGSRDYSDDGASAIERWNGRGWTVQDKSWPDVDLDVSCASAARCIALGESSLLVWNGRRWARGQVPSPRGAVGVRFRGVSCAAGQSCIVIGDSLSRSGARSALVARWDRMRWSSRRLPARFARLAMLSCSSATACWALGRRSGVVGRAGLVTAEWDGVRWSMRRAPPVPPHGLVGGLSCSSQAHCMIVGQIEPGRVESVDEVAHPMFAARLGRSGWRPERPVAPRTPDPHGLSAVSCASPQACTAVGQHGANGPLVERWMGSAWRIAPTHATWPADLASVACPSATVCTAVGGLEGPNGHSSAFAMRGDGAQWVRERAVTPAGAVTATLAGVSCASPADCMAAGAFDTEHSVGLLLQRGESMDWSDQTPITPTLPKPTALTAVSCSSPSACTAVGSAGPAPLALRWNGSDWVAQTAPLPPGAVAAYFTAVSCDAASCAAIGTEQFGPGRAAPLAEHWDGTDWTIESIPEPPDGQTVLDLTGLSCPSATACMAVGTYTSATAPYPDRPLAESWNGTTWSIETTADLPATTGAGFEGVDCVSPDSCVAVGFRKFAGPGQDDPNTQPKLPLVERSR